MQPTSFSFARFVIAFGLCMALGAWASGPALADIWTFETPSENIQCSVGQEASFSDISCTIINRSGPTAKPRPSNCTKDWGHTFAMKDRGRVRMECVRLSRNKDGHQRADYGVTGEFGGFKCHSSKKGLRCENRDGHGFFLSRRKQSVF